MEKKNFIKIDYFLTEDKRVGFNCDNYNKSFPLIIDPQLLYSTFIGGTDDEFFLHGDIELDSIGNIFITGRTMSSNFPVQPGSFDVSYNGSFDGFILKLNPSGTNLVYCTFFGGGGYDAGYAIEFGNDFQNLFVVGSTSSANFPVTPGAYHTTFNGGPSDCFLLKLDFNGNLIFSTLLGGTSDENPHGLSIDQNENIVVSGQARANFPTTPGSYITSYAGGSWDGFISKFDPTGSQLLYSTFLGGGGDDRVVGCDVDDAGNIYVVSFSQNGFPVTVGAFDQTFNGGLSDVTVSKLDPTLTNLVYSTYLGGSGNDIIFNGIKVNGQSGEAVLCGSASSGFPTTPGVVGFSYGGGTYDIFVTKLNSSGTSLIFSTFLGGPGEDQGFYTFLENDGEILIAGKAGQGIQQSSCPFDSSFNGGVSDAYICKLDPTGSSLQFSSYLGGNGDDKSGAITSSGDTLFFTGETSSGNFPVTISSFDQTLNGNKDIFISKMLLAPTAPAFTTLNGCAGDSIIFVPNSQTGSTYSWDFGDGTANSSSVSPSHIYPAAGTYNVTLSMTGCTSGSITQVINISSIPSLTITAPDSICQGDTALLTGNSAPINMWTGGGINDSSSVVLVTPSTTTTYYYTVSNGFCSNQDSVSIFVQLIPSNSISYPDSICSGQSATLTAEGGLSHQWSGDIVSSADTVWVTPGINNNYFIYFENGLCPDFQDTVNITVLPVPSATISGIDTICQGDTISLIASGTDDYFWNGGVTGNNDTILVSPQASTTYYLTATNGFCNGTTDSLLITVFPAPNAQFSFLPDCNSGVTFTNSSVNSSAYYWDFGDGSNTTLVSPFHTYPSPGNYNVVLTVNSGLICSDTISAIVQTFQMSEALFSSDQQVCDPRLTFINGSIGFTSILWIFGDGEISNELNPTHIFPASGLYSTSMITNPGMTCADTFSLEVLYEKYNSELLFPNVFTPNSDNSNDFLKPVTTTECTDYSLQIYDRWGILLFETDKPAMIYWDGKIQSGSMANPGIYYYILKNEDSTKKGFITLLR